MRLSCTALMCDALLYVHVRSPLRKRRCASSAPSALSTRASCRQARWTSSKRARARMPRHATPGCT